MRPDGRDLRVVAPIAIVAESLSWSADESALDFSTAGSAPGAIGALTELRIGDGRLRSIPLPGSVEAYDWQAIASGRPAPVLPSVVPFARSSPESVAPFPTPQAAPPADPSRNFSALAVDGSCDAGILDLRSLTPRTVGSGCLNWNGDVVAFAPQGAAYSLSNIGDGTVTVVSSDGAKRNVRAPLGPQSSEAYVETSLAWSPDGRRLAVKRCSVAPTSDCLAPEFVVVGADGRSLQRLPAMPSWSPDGQLLAVSTVNGDLLVGSSDGTNLHSIGRFPMPSSWSPTGTQFAFIRDGDVWIANADGTGERNASHFGFGGAFDAVWSPDGRFVAVIQESRLLIVRLDTGDLVPIALGQDRASIYGLSWSPDSARLAVEVGPGESPATLIVRSDDWTAVALKGAGIQSISWSPNGQFIALLDTSEKPGLIDVANGDGSGRRTIWQGPESSSRVTWVP